MTKIRKNVVFNLIIIVLFFVCSYLCDEGDNETVEVKLQSVVLSGKVEKSFLKHKEYFAFRGIPYAEPPVGLLRFQPPKPLTTLEGTYKAHDNKPTCLQFCTRERNGEQFGISGSEDCLYINVFTPALEGNYPVVVFDYNDNYRTGFNGSDTYSPDFFIEEGVIVVTINHRLGILGYLTTEDDVIPSNNGLRDFILGLNWIKDNIGTFGGDSTKITLMGVRGGAALAEILLHSKQATGLFSAVIMQSGTALETIFFYENSRAKAFELSQVVDIKTNDSKTLLEQLQKTDIKQLLLNEYKVQNSEMLLEKHMSVSIFVPTVEKEHENAIITSLPEKGAVLNDVPVLIGLTSREGLDLAQRFLFDPKFFEKVMGGITMNMPIRVNFKFDRESLVYNRDAAKEINEVYYNDGYLHLSNLLEYATYLGDVLHAYAIDKTAKTLAKSLDSPVFYYMFDFRGLLNENSEYLARYSRFNFQQYGATITDDLCYLHLCARNKKTYEQLNNLVSEQVEFKILKKMVRLWTNFAKTGIPTSGEDDSLIKDIKWEPINKQENEAKYLHITKKFQMKKEPLGSRAKFWDEFLDKYSKMAIEGVITDKDGQGYENLPKEFLRKTEELIDNQNDEDKTNKKDETTIANNIQETDFGTVVIVDDAKVTIVDKKDTEKYEPVNFPYEEFRDEL